jgi:hypothetical protein
MNRMRNFRKTRKRGGVGIATTVLKCVDPFKSQSKCLQEFLKQNHFTKYNILGDGNCFYRTIAKFFELSQNIKLDADYHLEIRKTVVNKMINNYENIEPYIDEKENANIELINNNNFKKKASDCNKIKEIKKLLRDGVWSSDTADIVTQYAAKALNMTFKIYDFKAATPAKRVHNKRINGVQTYRIIDAEPAKFVCYTLPPDVDEGMTIHMLRVSNSHYELLFHNVPVAPAPNLNINRLLESELPQEFIRSTITNIRKATKNNTQEINRLLESGLTEQEMENIMGQLPKKPFSTLKQNVNKPKTRKKPKVAPNISNNAELVKMRQADKNARLKQIEANEQMARNLEEQFKLEGKPPKKNSTQRKGRK